MREISKNDEIVCVLPCRTQLAFKRISLKMSNEVDLVNVTCDRFIENFKIESLKSVQRDSLKTVS